MRSTSAPVGTQPSTKRTRERPAWRRSATVTAERGDGVVVLDLAGLARQARDRPAGAAASASRRPPSRRQVGGHALLHGAARAPAHAEVGLDGAGPAPGPTTRAREASLRVELDVGVDVGRRAADVDHHHVATGRPARAAAAGRRRPGPTSGVAPPTTAANSGRREVLATDDVAEEHRTDRGAAESGARTPIRGSNVPGATCGVPAVVEDGATSSRRRRCRPPPGTAARPRRQRVRRSAAAPRGSPRRCPRPAGPRRAARRRSASRPRSVRAPADVTRPPLDSATRRPASAVTSCSCRRRRCAAPRPLTSRPGPGRPARGHLARQVGPAGLPALQHVGVQGGAVGGAGD